MCPPSARGPRQGASYPFESDISPRIVNAKDKGECNQSAYSKGAPEGTVLCSLGLEGYLAGKGRQNIIELS